MEEEKNTEYRKAQGMNMKSIFIMNLISVNGNISQKVFFVFCKKEIMQNIEVYILQYIFYSKYRSMNIWKTPIKIKGIN